MRRLRNQSPRGSAGFCQTRCTGPGGGTDRSRSNHRPILTALILLVPTETGDAGWSHSYLWGNAIRIARVRGQLLQVAIRTDDISNVVRLCRSSLVRLIMANEADGYCGLV